MSLANHSTGTPFRDTGNTKMSGDDYESDIRFGEWLRKLREKSGLSFAEVEKKSQISKTRLQSLETGTGEKGITKKESQVLSDIYGITLDTILKKAIEG